MVKFSEIYRRLEKAGWVKKGGSKHAKYVHPDYDYFIPVGRHPSKEIPTGTLKNILDAAGLNDEKK